MPPIYEHRLQKCVRNMQDSNIDCMLLTPGASMQYLVGFSEPAHERLLCIVLSRKSPPFFIVPALNADQALANPACINDVRTWSDSDGYQSTLNTSMSQFSDGIIAVDGSMPSKFLLDIQKLAHEATIVLADELVSKMRSIKDADELQALRWAAKITDNAFLAALRECRPGVSETHIANEVAKYIFEHGAELSFDTIIAAGPNSALPHHHTGNTVIQENDIVLFDLGAKIDGYCGDITRVVSVGSPTDKQNYVYKIVHSAYGAAIEKVSPGVPSQHVDAAARFKIKDYGFGDEFIHRTGHGIGLEPHESPNIVKGNINKLIPGNCFSVEPGIYLAGEFGVRLENIVCVTESGREILNGAIPTALLTVTDAIKFHENFLN